MAINSLTNAGEALVLKRSINWVQAAPGAVPTHDDLEIRLYFKEYDTDAYVEPNPDGVTGWGAEVDGDGYEAKPVYFKKTEGTETIPDTRPGADPSDTVTALLSSATVEFGPALENWRNPTSPAGDITADTANYRLVRYMAIWNTTVSPEQMVWYGELKNSGLAAQGKQVDLDDKLVFAADKVVISMD